MKKTIAKSIAILFFFIFIAITCASTIYLPVIHNPGDPTFNAAATTISARQTGTSAAKTATAEVIGQTATFHAIETIVSGQQTATSYAKTLTAAPPTRTPTITQTPVPFPVILDSEMVWVSDVALEITGHVQNVSELQHMGNVKIHASLKDKDGYTIGGEGIWDSGYVCFGPGDILPFKITMFADPAVVASYSVYVASFSYIGPC